MDNWVLSAIEREAMNRARSEFLRQPQTFSYMGVSEDRLAWLIIDYQIRNTARAADLDPEAPHAG